MPELSDEELMQRIQGEEPRLLAILFERHHRRIYNYFVRMTASRETAEDLSSEVFIRVLKYRSSYRQDARFTTWLYQVARNLFLDHIERQRPESSLDDLPQSQLSLSEPGPDGRYQHLQEQDLIRMALDRLPERKRAVLILSRFEEMKYDEIATVMGCSEGAVKILVHRSLKELKEIYLRISQGGRS